MQNTYQPGMSGSTGRLLIKGGVVFVIGFFLLLWLILGEATPAAFVLIVLVSFVSGVSLGAGMATKISSRSQEVQTPVLGLMGQMVQTQAMLMQMMTTAQPAASVAQLPAPRDGLLPVDDSTMVTKAQIQATASKIYHRMYPHTEPTRANIQELFPALKSNGYVTRCMEYLRDMEVVEGGGQGREYRWVVGE